MGATLVTLDARLARAHGPMCDIEVFYTPIALAKIVVSQLFWSECDGCWHMYWGLRVLRRHLDRDAAVEGIRRALHGMEHRALQPLDALAAPLEIRPLVTEFNQVLDRLEQAAAAQQRFVANAAHQLRTPLAGIRTQLELLQREADADERETRIRQSIGAIERLGHLINQMLVLIAAEWTPSDWPSGQGEENAIVWTGFVRDPLAANEMTLALSELFSHIRQDAANCRTGLVEKAALVGLRAATMRRFSDRQCTVPCESGSGRTNH
mgnify:CR=1 FL=1